MVSDNIGERIRHLRGRSRLTEFATRFKIHKSTLTRYEKGETQPDASFLRQLCSEFGVSPAWLLLGEGPMRLEQPSEPSPALPQAGVTNGDEPTVYSGDELRQLGFTLVPRYDIQVSLGPGAQVDSEQIVDHLAFKTSWLKNEMRLEPGKLALLSAVGDSMYPTIREEDLLLVDLRRREITEDAIYIIRRDSTLAAKRFQLLHDGTIKIKSDNRIYEEETIPREEAKNLNLVGRLVWIGRRA